MKKKKIICAMSGGVDSSVAAVLLLEKGYEVVGVTCQIWQNNYSNKSTDKSCCNNQAIEDAKKVAFQLGIKHYVLNYKKLFNDKVIKPFCNNYFVGKTPNPCIDCNYYIRTIDLLKKSLGMGFDYLATGHYARIIYNDKKKEFYLKTGLDKNKDQSYFLYQMNQFQLSHFIFPLGKYKKIEIREIAKKHNLCVSEKKDSQDICFISNNNYIDFIEKYLKKKKENVSIFHINGKYLGKGKPIYNYTIGQRKRLNISYSHPLYVIHIDNKNNNLILGEKKNLIVKEIFCNNVFFTSSYFNSLTLNKNIPVLIKPRYNCSFKKCILIKIKNGFKIKPLENILGVAIGQSVVLYSLDKETIFGGGKIIKYINK